MAVAKGEKKVVRAKTIASTVPNDHAKLLNQLHAEGAMRQDPLYALPESMIDKLLEGGVIDRGSSDAERLLASYCDARGWAGFYRHEPITCSALSDEKRQCAQYVELLGEKIKAEGKVGKLPMVAAELRRVLKPMLLALRAYAGWLVTNPVFLAEKDELFCTWSSRIRIHGIPRVWSSGKCLLPNVDSSSKELSIEKTFIEAFANFYIRWRLDGLAAPDLPVPLSPHLPIIDPAPIVWHIKHGGLAYFIPDTYPVPSRDELRRLAVLMQAERMPKHLAGWRTIIGRKLSTDGGLQTNAHALLLHHFSKVIASRHRTSLESRGNVMRAALAQHLGIKGERVRQLQRMIRCRLATPSRAPARR